MVWSKISHQHILLQKQVLTDPTRSTWLDCRNQNQFIDESIHRYTPTKQLCEKKGNVKITVHMIMMVI